jgi:hypothetical protein
MMKPKNTGSMTIRKVSSRRGGNENEHKEHNLRQTRARHGDPLGSEYEQWAQETNAAGGAVFEKVPESEAG